MQSSHKPPFTTTTVLTFIETDPPASSWFACWDNGDLGGLLESEPSDRRESVELVLPAKRGVSKVNVNAQRLDLGDAIDELMSIRHDDPVSRSVQTWAAVTRAALSFIAQGRLLPWVSPAGFDTWRIDPLSPGQNRLIAALGAGLTPEAHATPVTNPDYPKTKLIADPVYIVRSACDAIADRFLRTPAAHKVAKSNLFASQSHTRVDHLRPWVRDLAADRCASARLCLQLHPPVQGDETDQNNWRVRFQLYSLNDPSLLVDAAQYWRAPGEVIARLGEQAEVTLLSGLAQLGRLVPALESVLTELAPLEAQLDDEAFDCLLDAVDDLYELGIDVRWPADLLAPPLKRKLVIKSKRSTTSALPALMKLTDLVEVDWEFTLDGVVLTAGELDVLANAKRGLVSLRGRWVRLDRNDRAKLKAAGPKMSLADAIAAGLLAGGDDTNLELLGDRFGEPDERLSIALGADLTELVTAIGYLADRSRLAAEPTGLKAQLRPYQRQGLAWLTDLYSLGLGGCLADDMGLGKTVQVLALHAWLQQPEPSAPTLVVCPTSLLQNWQREAASFIPDVSTRLYHGPIRTLEGLKPGSMVITSYGVLRSDVEVFKELDWGLFVADEAQNAKNPYSATAKALRAVPALTRLALTGTPVENRLSELWSIFDWLLPGLFGPIKSFERNIATPIERDGDELAARRLGTLCGPFLLRRAKSDPAIAPELPAKIERDHIVSLSAEQATLYKATVDNTLEEIAQSEGIQRKGMVLGLLTKLKQITNHPAQFLNESWSQDQTGDLMGRSGKLDRLDELLIAAQRSDESTLIFTQYVQMGQLLLAHLTSTGYDCELFHGGLQQTRRQNIIDAFQASEIKVLILSLKAGGTGLNLTTASNVIHYDRWWNPAVEDQATDRAYRIGQQQTVMVNRLITKGTVEDRVAELIATKRKLADQVVGSARAENEAWISELSDSELAEFLTLNEIDEVF